MELGQRNAPQPSRTLLSDLHSRRFQSHDFDEIRHHVGQMFCDHDMRLVNQRARFDARTHSFECRALTIVDMSYGADVLIQPGSLDDFYLVQIPLSGGARVTIGSQEFDCRPGMATIQNPDDPLEMYWNDKCRKLVLRFDRACFERFVELQFGHVPSRALKLASAFDFEKPGGAAFASLIRGMNMGAYDGRRDIPLSVLAHWEMCFMSALLLMRTDDDRGMTTEDRRDAPNAVRRVREYLEANAENVVELADICGVAGVPLRTLHHQFRRSLGKTPMQLLREIRLDRVRRDLLRPHPGASVTNVALKWGFDHLGRFSASYRQRFGETPRETMKGSRAN